MHYKHMILTVAAGLALWMSPALAADAENAAPETAVVPVEKEAQDTKATHKAMPPAEMDASLCETGMMQSPVNIDQYQKAALAPVLVDYKAMPLHIKRTEDRLKIHAHGHQTISVNGTEYALHHMHFHTPSAHYIDGSPYPMALHFMHHAADATVAIIAVMLELGAHNEMLDHIWKNIPAEPGDAKADIEFSPAALMPADLTYFRYEGSLAMPPCTEGVMWHILKNPVQISEEQLRAYHGLFDYDARPVQPLNGRIIKGP